jgi:PIN domain nuclease of toxin-antitoxin system
MNLLLDTHTLIWFLEGSKKLSSKCKKLIEDDRNDKYVSIASFLEISIKVNINKLILTDGYNHFIATVKQLNFKILEISLDHTSILVNLERLHGAPFDRIIICQAIQDKLAILTKDMYIQQYEVDTIW